MPLAPPLSSLACGPGVGRPAEGKAASSPRPCQPHTAVLRRPWVLLPGLPLPRHGPRRRTAWRAPQPPLDPLRVPLRGSPRRPGPGPAPQKGGEDPRLRLVPFLWLDPRSVPGRRM